MSFFWSCGSHAVGGLEAAIDSLPPPRAATRLRWIGRRPAHFGSDYDFRVPTIDDVRAVATGPAPLVRGGRPRPREVPRRPDRLRSPSRATRRRWASRSRRRSARRSCRPTRRSSCCRGESDLRFNWVSRGSTRSTSEELTEFVLDAWRMVVPKFLASRSDDELLAGYALNSGGQGTARPPRSARRPRARRSSPARPRRRSAAPSSLTG